jgi:hypothetical protein
MLRVDKRRTKSLVQNFTKCFPDLLRSFFLPLRFPCLALTPSRDVNSSHRSWNYRFVLFRNILGKSRDENNLISEAPPLLPASFLPFSLFPILRRLPLRSTLNALPQKFQINVESYELVTQNLRYDSLLSVLVHNRKKTLVK